MTDAGDGSNDAADGGPTVAETDEPVRVRVRGIYTTGLTRLLRAAGHEVVRASEPIRRRFDGSFPVVSEAVRVETTPDRLGVGLHGDRASVTRLADRLGGVGLDAITVSEPAPLGAVFDARVTDTRGGGAICRLTSGESDREGYLPFDAADGYVEEGDRLRVQVHEPAPPWSDDRPELGTRLRAVGGLATLVRGRTEPRVAGGDSDAARELAGMTDLLDPDLPDGWGIEWARDASAAGLDALEDALDLAGERARRIDAGLGDDGDSAGDRDSHGESDSAGDGDSGRDTANTDALTAPTATAWVWFGRASRESLDGHRRAVTATMPGHHRIKAGSRRASAGVDFAEALLDTAEGFDADADFPFGVVTDQFGPSAGDRVRLAHGKPDGRCFSLGRATVTDCDPDGSVRLEREVSSSGTYDGLGTRREPGDTAVTKVREGRWWYPTTYRGADGQSKGTYVNVCTPVEVFPDAVRYVDLHVDVVQRPDGSVERVDDDELDDAVAAGHVTSALADRARSVASAVVRALSE